MDMNIDTLQFQGTANPYINVAPRSLAAQRLIPVAYPEEAELFCNVSECDFGLTRGLVIGGDVLGMAYAPLRQYIDPHYVSGSLYVIDAFGGFQILRDPNGRNYMNAQVGYRRVSFNDGTNTIVSNGVSLRVNYAQLITPIYLQGITFSTYFVGYSSLNNTQALPVTSSDHEKFANSANYFYRITQEYPTYRVALPADIEVANWRTEQTGLSAPLRTYAHIEPFYTQNNLNFSANNTSLLEQEQNFGFRLAGVISYESTENIEFGRYGFLGSVGMDIQSSRFTSTQSGNAALSLPGRKVVEPYINLAGSWTF